MNFWKFPDENTICEGVCCADSAAKFTDWFIQPTLLVLKGPAYGQAMFLWFLRLPWPRSLACPCEQTHHGKFKETSSKPRRPVAFSIPFISIVRCPGRPVILVPEVRRVRKVFSGLQAESPTTICCTLRSPVLDCFLRCEKGFARCKRDSLGTFGPETPNHL